MFQYIVRDLKIAFQRKYTYAYVIGIFALCLLANIAVVAFRSIYGTNEGTYAYNIIEYATWCFVIPYYSCIFIADMGFGKSYPNPQIKDKVTKNMSRGMIYFSKLITETILAVCFLLIAFLLLISITTVFQFKDGTISVYSIKDFVSKMLIAVPMWIAGVSIGNMFLFMFENKKKAYIWYFVITLIIPRIIMFFAAEPFMIGVCRFIRTYLISQNFSLLPYPADPARNVTLMVVLGIADIIISSIIGLVAYYKKKVDYINQKIDNN